RLAEASVKDEEEKTALASGRWDSVDLSSDLFDMMGLPPVADPPEPPELKGEKDEEKDAELGRLRQVLDVVRDALAEKHAEQSGTSWPAVDRAAAEAVEEGLGAGDSGGYARPASGEALSRSEVKARY